VVRALVSTTNGPILVTGGAGFIGSNFILHWTERERSPVVNFDKLTYAGNPRNVEKISSDARYTFVRADIADPAAVSECLRQHRPRAIVNFAAESHVDRSILGPGEFIRTNVRRREPTGRSRTRKNANGFAFCMFPQTKSMVRSVLATPRLPSKPHTRPTVRIRPQKRPRTTWCAPTITPMACRR